MNQDGYYSIVTPQDYVAPKQRKFRKPLIIFAIVAVLIIIVIAIAAIIWSSDNSSKPKPSTKLFANLVFYNKESSDYEEPADFMSSYEYAIDEKASQLDKDYFNRLKEVLEKIKDAEEFKYDGGERDYQDILETVSVLADLSNIEKIDVKEIYDLGREKALATINSRYENMINNSIYFGRKMAGYLRDNYVAELNIFVFSKSTEETDDGLLCYGDFGCYSSEKLNAAIEENEQLIKNNANDYYVYQNTELSRLKTSVYYLIHRDDKGNTNEE